MNYFYIVKEYYRSPDNEEKDFIEVIAYFEDSVFVEVLKFAEQVSRINASKTVVQKQWYGVVADTENEKVAVYINGLKQ